MVIHKIEVVMIVKLYRKVHKSLYTWKSTKSTSKNIIYCNCETGMTLFIEKLTVSLFSYNFVKMSTHTQI
jgi:hypothetical protein